MLDQTLRIGDLINVRTVIRLEEGRTRSLAIADSFVFTKEVSAHFSVLADAFARQLNKSPVEMDALLNKVERLTNEVILIIFTIHNGYILW